jgi:Domain of unknown function (DUF1737)
MGRAEYQVVTYRFDSVHEIEDPVYNLRFCRKVEAELAGGWEPLGGVAVQIIPGGGVRLDSVTVLLVQALIKRPT